MCASGVKCVLLWTEFFVTSIDLVCNYFQAFAQYLTLSRFRLTSDNTVACTLINTYCVDARVRN